VAKKRTPARKSSPKKKARKAARPVRKSATKAKAPRGVVDFRPVKKSLTAHIAKLEAQLGPVEARALAADQGPVRTLEKLHQLSALMTDICQPTMVIGS
jgi:hypothetical protein